MFNRYLTYYNPWVQILVFCILFLISLVVNAGIDIAITPYLSNGIAYQDISNATNYSKPEIIRTLKWLQLISQIFIFFIPSLLFAYLAYPKVKNYLHLDMPKKNMHWIYAIVLMLVSIPFIDFLEHINKMIPLPDFLMEVEDLGKIITEAFLNDASGLGGILNIVMFVLLAAIGEELFFRGVLQNIMVSHWYKKTPLIGILITAILFSLFHGQMHGFIPRFFAGFIIGVAFHYSNSILLAILMHMINNGLSLIAYYGEQQNMFSPDDMNHWLMGIFGIASAFIIYQFLKKKSGYSYHYVETEADDKNNPMTNKFSTYE